MKLGRPLDLRNTLITDDGLKNLATIKNLTQLDLFGSKITDAGLAEFSQLENLR